MYRSLLALFAVLVLITPLPAQAPSGITGFSSVSWGSTLEDVVAKEQAQPISRIEVNGLVAYAFQIQLQGHSASAWYYLHPEAGLVAGAYTIPYLSANDCWTLYTSTRDAIRENYRSIRPRIDERTERTLNHCVAATIGRGRAVATWRDPSNGSAASVEVRAAQHMVQVMYVNPLGAAAFVEASANERRDRF